MSHVEFKKWLCRMWLCISVPCRMSLSLMSHDDFKKGLCRRVEWVEGHPTVASSFQETAMNCVTTISLTNVNFRNVLWHMSKSIISYVIFPLLWLDCMSHFNCEKWLIFPCCIQGQEPQASGVTSLLGMIARHNSVWSVMIRPKWVPPF